MQGIVEYNRNMVGHPGHILAAFYDPVGVNFNVALASAKDGKYGVWIFPSLSST